MRPNLSIMSDWGATQRVSAEVMLADGVVLEGDLHLVPQRVLSARTRRARWRC